MREFKFRLWDLDQYMFHGPYELHEHMGFGDGGSPPLMTVRPIIQQYTGLKDKNGKEIYAGDIVQTGWRRDPIVVAWVCSTGFFPFTHPADGLWGEWECATPQESEVIGNIYENPELLEGK